MSIRELTTAKYLKIVPPNEDISLKVHTGKSHLILQFDKTNGHASVTISCASSLVTDYGHFITPYHPLQPLLPTTIPICTLFNTLLPPSPLSHYLPQWRIQDFP